MNELATQAQDYPQFSQTPSNSRKFRRDCRSGYSALKERHDAKQAEREFNAAFVAAQSELLPVAKCSAGTIDTKSFFARAEHVQQDLDYDT